VQGVDTGERSWRRSTGIDLGIGGADVGEPEPQNRQEVQMRRDQAEATPVQQMRRKRGAAA
jgi:hypothetical protein